MHEPVIALASILMLGIASQWLAWRLKLPSILLLLLSGIVAGPLLGWIEPDALFPDTLMPLVSLSVAVILYEGGLTLHRRELAEVGSAVRNLVTLGALVTWLLGSLGAMFVLGMDPAMGILLGAVLVVTGPTVIQPMLRHIRPIGPTGGILKWEGIVIDPIGALLALLVFEAILPTSGDGLSSVGVHTLVAIGKTLVGGGVSGAVFAFLLVELLRRYWIPDYLGSAVSLAFALLAYTLANLFQEEAGLVAVTLMGILVANQRRADVEDIVEFKENLRVLLIAALFILLAARLPASALASIGWREALFVLVLIAIVRPAAVFASTWSEKLTNAERVFLSVLAPRGIVAAAVSSIFALRLAERGVPGADRLTTVTFAVIVGTVLVYGFLAPIVARRLKLAESDPQGLLIVGVDPFTRALARVLTKRGFAALLVDTNREHTRPARLEGLPTHTGSALGEDFLNRVSLGGIGRVLAMTPNPWVNVLTVHRFEKVFGAANCYQVAPERDAKRGNDAKENVAGRVLFDEEATHDWLNDWMTAGGQIKATQITDEFTFEDYLAYHGTHARPILTIGESKRLRLFTTGEDPAPKAGETVVSLVDAEDPDVAAQVAPTPDEMPRGPDPAPVP